MWIPLMATFIHNVDSTHVHNYPSYKVDSWPHLFTMWSTCGIHIMWITHMATFIHNVDSTHGHNYHNADSTDGHNYPHFQFQTWPQLSSIQSSSSVGSVDFSFPQSRIRPFNFFHYLEGFLLHQCD